jgi:hypothetical protein
MDTGTTKEEVRLLWVASNMLPSPEGTGLGVKSTDAQSPLESVGPLPLPAPPLPAPPLLLPLLLATAALGDGETTGGPLGTATGVLLPDGAGGGGGDRVLVREVLMALDTDAVEVRDRVDVNDLVREMVPVMEGEGVTAPAAYVSTRLGRRLRFPVLPSNMSRPSGL